MNPEYGEEPGARGSSDVPWRSSVRSCWGGTGCCSPQATGDEAGPLLCGALGAILGAAPPDPSNEHKQGGGDPWGGRWPWRR